MSFLDKVKSGVRSGAGQAATRAQQELDRLQAKRSLQGAYGDLGKKAFDLVDRGELSHGELTPLIDRVRTAKSELDAIGSEPEPAPEAAAEADSTAEPGSGNEAEASGQPTEFHSAG
jgi:hypothetical protein